MSVEAVLGPQRGLVIAPAGCGKTHLITETVQVTQPKPYLVLTHTTAGVAALKKRLRQFRVSNKDAHVATIDGWSLSIANKFPATCHVTANPKIPKYFYPDLQNTVCAYLQAGHLNEILAASYSRLLVDEYQDCGAKQHEMICELSQVIPTIVFGDPLQAIFDFAGPLPAWEEEVKQSFPPVLTLDRPYRWENAGTPALGEWILSIRQDLLAGKRVDLRSCGSHVTWSQLSGDYRSDTQTAVQTQYRLREQLAAHETLLVIGDSKDRNSRHSFARSVIGVDVVEPVDMSEIISAARAMDNIEPGRILNLVLTIGESMMTSVGKTEVIRRVGTITAGRNRMPPTEVEAAAIKVMTTETRESVLGLIESLERSPGAKIYRRSALNAMKATLLKAIQSPDKSITEIASSVIEQRRHYGDRRVLSRAIGSTLLLKGLESDHAFIIDATPMDAKNLYVALSRGAKSITVCSRSPMCP
jgi:DNA helicase-2/ATP-dependent DNA helicase PcrA